MAQIKHISIVLLENLQEGKKNSLEVATKLTATPSWLHYSLVLHIIKTLQHSYPHNLEKSCAVYISK